MSLLSRRQALAKFSNGFGLLALAGLLARRAPAAGLEGERVPRTDFAPKARHVIFCFMSGGVSHVDSFDPKPRLRELAGQPMPMPVARTQFNNNGKINPSYWDFRARGQCGTEVSELFPRLAEQVDEMCVIRSMTSKFSEHAQGNLFLHTGFPFAGYPSAGAWASYGLGAETEELPGFVVLRGGDAGIPHGGVGLFGNGFLPARHQASILSSDGAAALPNLRPASAPEAQRRELDFIGQLDRAFAAEQAHDPHLEAAIRNYELAWRMQSAVPALCDLAGESPATRALYGVDDPDAKLAAYARECLVARRLVERGVRFVELSCLSANVGGGNPPNPWDHHGDLRNGHASLAHQVDQPIAALLTDLKARGLLNETLVIWAGEFGRTPFSQGSNGRDHNPYGFSVWMAGGGVKAGSVYGGTDELGYRAVDRPCTVYDLWATVLHLLGLNHETLTFRYSGRDVRLSDVHGQVLREVLA